MEESKGRYLFDLTIGKNETAAHIDGNEVFRLTFNPQNFTEKLYKSVPIPKPQEGVKKRLRSILKQHNIKRSEEEIDTLIEQEFDADTITWLKSRPVLKDVP